MQKIAENGATKSGARFSATFWDTHQFLTDTHCDFTGRKPAVSADPIPGFFDAKPQ